MGKISYRNALQKKIWQYEKRLETIRQKHSEDSIDYKYLSRNLALKINLWQNMLGDTDVANKKLQDIDENMFNYFGFRVRNIHNITGRKTGEDKKLPLSIFIKLAAEGSIPVGKISRYLGFKESDSSSRRRTELIRSFKDHPENKELFNNFKNYNSL